MRIALRDLGFETEHLRRSSEYIVFMCETSAQNWHSQTVRESVAIVPDTVFVLSELADASSVPFGAYNKHWRNAARRPSCQVSL
jgi:hypothetical protein